MKTKKEIQNLISNGDVMPAFNMLSEHVLGDPPFYEYPWLTQMLEQCCPNAVACKVGILSTYTIEHIKDCIRGIALANSFNLDVYFGGFHQLEQELMSSGSSLARHEPDIIFINWRLEDVSPVLWHSLLELNQDQVNHELEHVQKRINDLIELAYFRNIN